MTKTTGLIGYPVSHSLSPHIHSYWLKEHGLDADYKLFTTAPARLRQTILHMRKKNAIGLNVTVPHKQAVMEYLDSHDEAATRIGAVNTILNRDGKFIGSNTDAYGFITNLKNGLGELKPYLENVVLLGAGGATRAAIVALIDEGAARITLTNRTQEKAETLAQYFSIATATPITVAPWDDREKILREATLLVNTTSLGMISHHLLHLDVKQLPRDAAVHDIVYAPLETELLKNAKKRGLKTVDGLGMLLYQAQAAFAQWHGVTPEVTQKLRAHIMEQLA
ncbi:MAG: shikimate dehydrogenase [Pseudomonadota bacterium]